MRTMIPCQEFLCNNSLVDNQAIITCPESLILSALVQQKTDSFCIIIIFSLFFHNRLTFNNIQQLQLAFCSLWKKEIVR